MPKDMCMAEFPSAASFGTKGAEYDIRDNMSGHLRAHFDIDTKGTEVSGFRLCESRGIPL